MIGHGKYQDHALVNGWTAGMLKPNSDRLGATLPDDPQPLAGTLLSF